MAGNFWTSTQHLHWQFSKPGLAEIRRKLEQEDRALVQQYPLPDRRLLSIYFYHQIGKLGKRLTIRQQALATAQVYIRRFYTKVEIRRTNPYLVLVTALYLACKMEECPQHIRLVVAEARNIWPDFISSDTSKLGECEFFLISEMRSQLIIHQPYRTLLTLHSSFSMTQDEINLAWSVINDHYLTDLPLLYPPHVIAVAAIFLAVVLKPAQASLHGSNGSAAAPTSIAQAMTGTPNRYAQQFPATNTQQIGSSGAAPQNKVQYLVNWLAESDVDMEAVIDCTQEIISLYEVWEQYNDKVCKEQITRFVKARGLDK
ncbi:cyclin domain-containing protein [Xylona heveae TC161]|uniref:RNA polymerase II holoenzyme cyclin-like subunit n=1 Tax=Xylona heveae (strain CBS 132557 / TC161) TaxID=1328760 RepID=A0A164ZQ39_XYLHT|nr:cyclin domain-containing protein [Xylona heveae TC161]KZF19364.1 cyclin domain-containing protein [Xylona heveae TC161]